VLPLKGLKDVVYVLFTQYEQKCFIRYKHETTAGCFISDKAWTANVLQVNYVKRSSFDFITHLEFSSLASRRA
jgi:hypothetical protein